MKWDCTFALYGLSPSRVTQAIGLRESDYSFIPLDNASGVKVLAYNKNQSLLYELLQRKKLIGVLNDSKKSGDGNVYCIGKERTYVIKLDDALKAKIRTVDGLTPQEIDCLFVKVWKTFQEERSALYRKGDELAKREYETLLRLDKENIQQPVTIPVALLSNSTKNEIQLIKLGEPMVTYNHLEPLAKMLNDGKKDKIHEDASVEVFTNWAKLASSDIFQTQIIPLDHNGEDWVHDNGLDGKPGHLTGKLGGPSNFGFIRVNNDVKCIVKDFEHVMKKTEMYDLSLPHGDVWSGDLYSSKLGSTAGSLTAMITRIGLIMGLDNATVTKNLNKAMIAGYNTLYGRNRTKTYELGTLLKDIRHHIKNGTMETASLASLIDQFIAPEYMRVGLELIDGSYHDHDKGIRIPKKSQILNCFIDGTENNWEVTDEVMDNLVEIGGGESAEDDPLIPKEHVPFVLQNVASIVKKNPNKALKVSQRIYEEEPQSMGEIKKIIGV